MAKYHVTVDSPFEGVNTPHLDVIIDTADGQMQYEGLTDAKSIAQFYAGDYCDSGSVTVESVESYYDRDWRCRRPVDRHCVGRRSVAS